MNRLISHGQATRSTLNVFPRYPRHVYLTLDRWLRQRGMAIKAFKEQRIQQFLRYRRSRYSRQSGDSATLCSLLRHLREIKVIPSPLAQHEVSPPKRPCCYRITADLYGKNGFRVES